ncbi:hypothetical protein [Virgibacillus salexigens]|uniref:Calcineurin-like phosphoesterase domain-containing protein n=1 Tax=Virgibacillus kapii TaxID=1638645 RepID=A0ABQ2D7E5_9BACI|nr:hypothetical protein [Virgibacillus kapii]GGJ48583.1 hypothetical protein GCM10007111_08370 [Virgibacillus kapii]
MKWDDEKHNYLIDLVNEYDGRKKWQEITKKMSDKFGDTYNREQVRGHYRIEPNKRNAEMPDYKSSVEINQDGSQTVNDLIELSNEQMKDSNYLLKAHGYDPNEWEIVKATSSKWHHYNKEMSKPRELYASKITVRKKKQGFDFDKLLDTIKEVPQVNISPIHTEENSYLNIPLSDMHFGIATYEDYKETQNRIINIIQKGHEEILFIIGNDLYHVDNFRNATASGREIQQIDLVNAWNSAKLFYYPLLENALRYSRKVKVIFTLGNHSESMEWSFIQLLKERYKQIVFDDDFKERKAHMLGKNLIFSNHGDKKKAKNITENFAVEFPVEWSEATTRTVFVGHYHFEKVIDNGGVIVRQMPTGVTPDIWHEQQGYTTAHKRFQVHEYDYESERCIYYV